MAAQAFNGTQHGQAASLQYASEWRKDATVQVRQFRRTVRGGGASLVMTMIVVRRKVLPPMVEGQMVNAGDIK